MTYFYKIGDFVLVSDQSVAWYEYTQNGEYRLLTFSDNATVSTVELGDTYEPDKE